MPDNYEYMNSHAVGVTDKNKVLFQSFTVTLFSEVAIMT